MRVRCLGIERLLQRRERSGYQEYLIPTQTSLKTQTNGCGHTQVCGTQVGVCVTAERAQEAKAREYATTQRKRRSSEGCKHRSPNVTAAKSSGATRSVHTGQNGRHESPPESVQISVFAQGHSLTSERPLCDHLLSRSIRKSRQPTPVFPPPPGGGGMCMNGEDGVESVSVCEEKKKPCVG